MIRQANARQYAANPEKRRADSRAWHHANIERVRARHANDRARAYKVEGSLTANDIVALKVAQHGLCAYCGKPYGNYQVDHKTPMARGGANTVDNIVLACASCNHRKYNRTEAEFQSSMGQE